MTTPVTTTAAAAASDDAPPVHPSASRTAALEPRLAADSVPVDPSAAAPAPPFHRLARLAVPLRWWRPLLVLVTMLASYAVLLMVVLVAGMVAGLAVPAWAPALDEAMELNSMNRPGSLGVMLLLIALMFPAGLLAVAWAGRRRPGTLLSVTGRFRWPLLGRSVVVTVVVLAAFQGVALLLDPSGPSQPLDLARILPGLVVVALITPWQAAAEEVVFRGLLMQTVGAWLRHPAWAILLPVPLFVAGHAYNSIGLIDIAVFAVVAGYLTWRTGGLEAAIGLHVVNNVVGLALGLITGADLDATEIAPLDTALSVAYTLVTAALILVWHRRSARRAAHA